MTYRKLTRRKPTSRKLDRRHPAGACLAALLLAVLATAAWPFAAAAATDGTATAAPPAPASAADLEGWVSYLASDELEGRLTGSPGADAAAEYLSEQLAALGAEPLPGRDSFRLPFEFTAGTEDAGSSLALGVGEGGQEGEDAEPLSFSGTDKVQALSFSDSGNVTAPLVFAGYGLVIPEGQDVAYDSYAGVDVDGKVAVVLRYFPEDASQETRSVLARYSGLRYKALHAREHGAVGMLVVTGPRSPNAGEVVPMTFDTAISGSGLLAASVSGEVAQEIFRRAGKDLEAAQKSLDDANPHVTGFDLPGVEATLTVEVKRERREGVNLVAVLPATVDAAALPEKPWIVLGAHYDHLGRGGHGNSLAKKEEAGMVHHGADDNASGVAALLAAGRRLAAMERGRNVALALWSGEELGLLGSADFVDGGALATEQVAAYLNFDMVGRLRDDKLTVQAVGSSPVWPGYLEAANVPVGFDLNLQDDPYLPTDSASFNRAKVPTLHFFTGNHEDYHRPSDTAQKIDYEGIGRVARLASLVVRKVASEPTPPEFVTVERKAEAGGDRDTLRAYTGTIPDYTTEVEGLRLSGVVEGGPAEEAGLREGDVIVQFGGQEITNIYDYTYALDAVKIGEPVKVVVMRDGERVEVTVTPRARR
jgi:hypothetical protein